MAKTQFLNLETIDFLGNDKTQTTANGLIALAGVSPESNMNKIDKAFELQTNAMDILKQKESIQNIHMVLSSSSENLDFYTATSESLTKYKDEMLVLLSFSESNKKKVSLNINDLGVVNLKKYNINSELVELEENDIKKDISYLYQMNLPEDLSADKDLILVGEDINGQFKDIINSVQSLSNSVDEKEQALQQEVGTKAPINSPTFTGAVKGITKDMVGLDKVDNTLDNEKDVLSATKLTKSRKINGVGFDGTKDIIIKDETKIPLTQKGQANGVATLGVDSKIPSEQLPSYVDDVLEFKLKSQLPTQGDSGKIYIVYGDTKKNSGSYRWSGTTYILISNPIDIATEKEAINGTDDTKMMTPKKVKSVVDAVDTKVTTITTDLATKAYDNRASFTPKPSSGYHLSANSVDLVQQDTFDLLFTPTVDFDKEYTIGSNIYITNIHDWYHLYDQDGNLAEDGAFKKDIPCTLTFNKATSKCFFKSGEVLQQQNTYTELKALKVTDKLVAGQQYLLTDYVTKYQQPSTNKLKVGRFDLATATSSQVQQESERLVLTATSSNTFDIVCSSIDFPQDKIWYDFDANICEDNLTPRNGFILHRDNIIREISAPNDWRKIKWARYKKDFGMNEHIPLLTALDSGIYNGEYYTFDNGGKEASELCYGITVCGNMQNMLCNTVWIIDANDERRPLHDVSIGSGCYNNTFDLGCYHVYFGADCHDNTFGSFCGNNIFGSNCKGNVFGADCDNNTFGDKCTENHLCTECSYNTFGVNCYRNILGCISNTNTFGADCHDNTFGNENFHITLCSSCYDNTFGEYCHSIVLNMWCTHNIFGNDCHSIVLNMDCTHNTFGTISNFKIEDLSSKNLTAFPIPFKEHGAVTITSRRITKDNRVYTACFIGLDKVVQYIDIP